MCIRDRPESTAQAGAPEPAAIETGLNGVQQNLPEVLADNSAQMVLMPVADDYAQDNNGSRDASQLRLKNYPADPGFHRIVYIKYDVSEVAAKTGTDNPDGTLRLYIKGMNSDKLTWFNVYAADSNDWTEGGTMKWEDKPAEMCIRDRARINKAAKALNDAIDALVPASAESSVPTPDTGDTTNFKWPLVVMIIALIVVAGSVVAMQIVSRKRKKDKK